MLLTAWLLRNDNGGDGIQRIPHKNIWESYVHERMHNECLANVFLKGAKLSGLRLRGAGSLSILSFCAQEHTVFRAVVCSLPSVDC